MLSLWYILESIVQKGERLRIGYLPGQLKDLVKVNTFYPVTCHLGNDRLGSQDVPASLVLFFWQSS